ncbi:hypothetical protein PV04_07143 [Phialophora macrospora]|uniref:Major facilitator superfamily (MFS) profile domain-containing protein n=1 Tax=Phialophora macrospora TaxID=1851006 RepID=A0A0D2DRJ6_9EURO|nr:hypothetical protein PV04_07143 [Phialophora macrospora]
MLFQSIVIVSMAVLLQFAPHIATDILTRYAMFVLACLGVYPIVPGCNAWTVNILAVAEKRSMGVAFMVTVGNMGGFIGSWIFLKKVAPRYPAGFGTSLAFAAAGFVAKLLFEYLYWRHSKMWEECLIPEYWLVAYRALAESRLLFAHGTSLQPILQPPRTLGTPVRHRYPETLPDYPRHY